MKISKSMSVVLLVIAMAYGGFQLYLKRELEGSTEIVDREIAVAQLQVEDQDRLQKYQPSDFSRDKFPLAVIDPNDQLKYFSGHLIRMAKNWETDLGIEVNILIATQQEDDISRFAEEVFQTRRIGENFPTGGILVFIDPTFKQAKIEVSYSLEGVLPDARTGLIAKNQLAPYASYSFIGMSLMDSFHFLKDYLYIQSMSGAFNLDKRYKESKDYQSKAKFLSGGGGAKSIIGDLTVDQEYKEILSKSQLVNYQPSRDILKSVAAYSNSLRNLVGYPDLPLFTEGSRVLRTKYPAAPFESLSRYRKLEDSKPYVVHQNGDYAVVTTNTPAHGFVPVLLKKVDDLWRIDESETWKNLFFDGNGNYYLKNKNTPYAFGLTKFGSGENHDLLPLDVEPGQLENRIKELQDKGNAYSDFLAAELLFRNAFAALEALRFYEKAARNASNDNLIQSVLADRYLYLGFSESAIPIYKQLGSIAQLKLANAYAISQRYKDVEITAKAALKRNPFSNYALRWLEWSLEKQNKNREAEKIRQQLEDLLKDKSQKWKMVWLTFNPPKPKFNRTGTRKVGDVDVYGHSEFSVTMTNHSNRKVIIDSLKLYSQGAGGTSSGLGDITSYFNFKKSPIELGPRQSIGFNKVWGFTVDSKHDRLSYIFDLCWHGDNGDEKQCQIQELDLSNRSQG